MPPPFSFATSSSAKAARSSKAYQEIARDHTKLANFIGMARKSSGASDPFWQVASTTIDGEEVKAKALLKRFKLGKDWPRGASSKEKEAIRTLRDTIYSYAGSINRSVDRARGAGDCKLDELMVLAGQPSPTIISRILPRLVKQKTEDGRSYWTPDMLARSYVQTVHKTAGAIRALKEYASIDDAYKSMAMALVGGGGAFALARLGKLAAAAYLNIGVDLADAAYFGTKGVLEYVEAKRNYEEYAVGASAALGAEIYEDLKAAKPSGLGVAASVLLPVGSAGLSGLGLRRLRQVQRGAKVAKRLGKIDDAAINGLSQADRVALLAYVQKTQAKADVASMLAQRHASAEGRRPRTATSV